LKTDAGRFWSPACGSWSYLRSRHGEGALRHEQDDARNWSDEPEARTEPKPTLEQQAIKRHRSLLTTAEIVDPLRLTKGEHGAAIGDPNHVTDAPPSIVTRFTERKVAHHLPSACDGLSHRARFNGLDHQGVVTPSRDTGQVSTRTPRPFPGIYFDHRGARTIRAKPEDR
jgi:hypothetical protein